MRGSTLLLAGRLTALAANFAVQVLTVRYLAKSDYGAFAYALAVASMGASVVVLGLNRGVNRFVPIDQENRDYASMFGTMLLALAAVAGLGLAVVILVIGAGGFLTQSVSSDPLPIGLLLILIGLAPLQALDSLFEGLVATFATPRALCVRRYVIGPGLKLAAVLLVIVVQGSVQLLAWCYLLAGGLGVAIYLLVLHRALADSGLLAELRRRRPVLGARRLLGFSLPLLSTDIFLTLKVTLAVVILESFRGTTEVAELRAVAPVAGLCAVVVQSFKMLFTPMAARLYARNDQAGLNDLYWRSTIWITVATFPVFGVCFFLAEPVTVLLFGPRYADAGVLLAILAAGVYFSAALGLNLYVLQIYARVRAITLVNTGAIVLTLVLNLWLVPLYGAVGAAAAITATVVAHKLLVHAGLLLRTGVDLFPARFLKVYVTTGAGFAALWTLQRALTVPAVAMLAALAVVSVVLLRVNRGALEIGETFPKLAHVPLLRRVLGVQFG
ncbi:MAG: oligosaccharide flippase family protein [Planctomycetota bacterium]